MLLLVGCGSAAPEFSEATPSSMPPASPTAPTSSPTVAPSPTISKAVAAKTEYAGTTALGEHVSFFILDGEEEQAYNRITADGGKVQAWGLLCSPDATANQLGGYTISTSGEGHVFYYPARRIILETDHNTEIYTMSEGARPNAGVCIPMVADTLANSKKYDTATIYQEIGGDLKDAKELD